jgi:hypothetical protein
MRACPIDEVASQATSWLWEGRLALGKLALLDGDPGLGKSLVALDWCARLSTGRPFPDGKSGPGLATAIVLNGEDDCAQTLRPRLQALGADLSRVFILQGDEHEAVEPLRLPGQVAFLEKALAQTQARLVVIDPVSAFLEPGVIVGNDQSARRALQPLIRLAELRGCAVLLVRHLNKARGSRALYRGLGSVGFIGACRSGWLIARDPAEPARCVLAQVKNNLAPPQPSLAYQVHPGEDGLPRLEWQGVVGWTADALLAGVSRPAPVRPYQRAAEFLKAFLEAGPRTSRDIWSAAQERDLTERTLRRVKRRLRIGVARVWAGGRRLSYWLLPGQKLPAGLSAEDPLSDLEPWLAPLREQFPPPTPLDED